MEKKKKGLVKTSNIIIYSIMGAYWIFIVLCNFLMPKSWQNNWVVVYVYMTIFLALPVIDVHIKDGLDPKLIIAICINMIWGANGDIFNFYQYAFYDVVGHTYMSFMLALVGVYFYKIVVKGTSDREMIFFVIAFTMLAFTGWEILEWCLDIFTNNIEHPAQPSLNDTMEDFVNNILGMSMLIVGKLYTSANEKKKDKKIITICSSQYPEQSSKNL